MIKMDPYGESTIAIGVYNIVNLTGRPIDFDELFDRLKNDFGFSHLTEDLLSRSIEKLLKMKLVSRSGDLFHWVDPKRRVIVSRSRDDENDIDEESGIFLGGWKDWMIRDPKKGIISIKAVTG